MSRGKSKGGRVSAVRGGAGGYLCGREWDAIKFLGVNDLPEVERSFPDARFCGSRKRLPVRVPPNA